MTTRKTHMKNLRTLAPLAALAAAAVSGCAEPVKDINYVYPGYISKAQFKGEWYYRETITKSDPTLVTGGFVGAEAELEKLRWEIQEGQLLAYRLHEAVPGLDQDETLPGATYQGEPVAAFKILSHFDIARKYNAATGEQANVIEENTSDRPWYEREYIRIEPVNTLPTAANVGGWTFAPGALTWAWFETEKVFSPEQPVVEPDYLEFTTRQKLVDWTFCGNLYGDESACSSGDVNIRHSFVRIDPEDAAQYEPRIYDDLIPLKDADGKALKTNFFPVPITRLFNGGDVGAACTTSAECGFTLACVEGVCGACTASSQCAPGEFCVRHYDDVFDTRAEGDDRQPGECSVPFAETACTPELFDELNKKFAEGYYVPEDCSPANFKQFERFGIFRTERNVYSRETGRNRDENRQYFANLHQIWQQSYKWADGSATDGVRTVAKDEAGAPVAIPMTERKARPVIYYLNIDFPDDLKETAYQIAGDWNEAMLGAVMAGTGKSRATVEAELAAWGEAHDRRDQWIAQDTRKYKGMFQIRENNCSVGGIRAYLKDHPTAYKYVVAGLNGDENGQFSQILTGDEPDSYDPNVEGKALADTLVPGNLHRVCATLHRGTLDAGVTQGGVADPFRYQKVGDIRFNFLNWVNEQQPSGPLGYGPSSTDGENGHVLSANANIYGAGLDNYARNSVDVIRAMNGDLAVSDLLEGKNISEWLERQPSETLTGTVSQGLSAATLKKAEARKQTLLAHTQAANRPDVAAAPQIAHGKRTFDALALTRQARQVFEQAKPVEVDPSVKSPGWERLGKAMQDPEFAARVVPEDFVQALAPLYAQDDNPAAEPTADQRAAAALASTDLRAFARQQDARTRYLEQHRIDTFEMIDDAVIGKALELRDKDPETLYLELRKEIFRGVTLHEIGHTMGLTHNFEGSYDALNYQDGYWKDLKATRAGDADGNGVEDRLEKRIPEKTYSTIMDYHGRFNSDHQGLGKYDLAAMKYAYAGKVEMFADDVKVPAVPDMYLYTAYVYGNDALPSMLGDSTDTFTERKDVDIAEAVKERTEGILGNTQVVIDSFNSTKLDGLSVPRDVPYAYCEHAYLFRARCKQFDQGSNNYEVVHSSIQRYWNYYTFNNFRRGRSPQGFVNAFFNRQAGLLDDMTYAIRYFIYGNQGSPLGRDFLRAALEALNFINLVMGTPTPGRHCLDSDRGVFTPYTGTEDCQTYVDVPEGEGRDPYLEYDDQYLYNVNYLGSFFDKSNFLIFLLDDSTNFFNVTDFGDSRRFSINYYRLFRPELITLVRDMVFSYLGVGGNNSFGALVDAEGKVHQPLLADPQTWGLDREGGQDLDPSAALYRVDAPVPARLMWRALALSTVFNSSAFDGETDFRDYILIFEAGSAEARKLADDTETVSYLDPVTHVTYVAPQTTDGLSISVELLNYFNTQAAQAAALRAAADAAPDDAAAEAAAVRAEGELGHFSDLINDFRFFRAASEPYAD